MNDILTAIKAIVKNSSNAIVEESDKRSLNRATQMGDALEDYVKNAFADCLGQDLESTKQARQETFSYLGNSSNPPDAILKGSDAIEIKKIASLGTSQLQLNSSYPKDKLYADNPKLCKTCRECENWKVKDMIYVVGQVNGENLHNIFFVYGDLYCDSREIYEGVENVIKEGLESLTDVEVAKTNELGRINKVDHLGISDLRVRGMWLIKTPFHLFEYLTDEITNYSFKLVALIPDEKYNRLGDTVEFENFCKEHGVTISDAKIEDPRNPAKYINSKLITYYY